MKAADVVASVRRHYGAERDGYGPEWAALEEFSLGAGGLQQRADLFLIRAWGGKPKGHERHAIEVKVSRADLRAELANPGKSQPFDAVAHRFYLAAPHGLVKDTDTLPAHWGLYEISSGGRCRKSREAIRDDSPDPMPEGAIVEAFRRAARSEARIRGAAEDDTAARLADLERRYNAVHPALSRAQAAAEKAKREKRDLLSEIASAGGWFCVCGQRTKRTKWDVRHSDGSDCTEGYGGRAVIDMESLAVRLGIADPEQADDEPDQAVAFG